MHIVIIGNGITGVTAALRLRRRDPECHIDLVSGESNSFFSRPALMYVYMGHMRVSDTQPFEESVWPDNRIERVRGWVTGIDTEGRKVHLDGQPDLGYDKLLLATGSVSNRFGWKGQDLDRVHGFYGLADLEALERATPDVRAAVVVGGGLIGIELAEMLHARGIHVTMLAREEHYWNNALPDEEAILVERRIRAHGIDLRLRSELEEIHDDGQGRACAVTTGDGERIEAQLVGLTAGVAPNLSAVRDSDIETGRGILVDEHLKTPTPDVFAAGDCAEIVTPEGERNLVEQLWYTGRMQGEVVADNMAGDERTYARGTWFNSAKFLDLEWHTYGRVPSSAAPDPEVRSLWWEAPSGLHALRIVHRDGVVTGVNALGLRQRQEVWIRWLDEAAPVERVLDHLHEANFDPELFRKWEPTLVPALREQLA